MPTPDYHDMTDQHLYDRWDAPRAALRIVRSDNDLRLPHGFTASPAERQRQHFDAAFRAPSMLDEAAPPAGWSADDAIEPETRNLMDVLDICVERFGLDAVLRHARNLAHLNGREL